MPFIQNIPAMDLPDGYHKTVGPNAVLIQIMDTDVVNWPVPKIQFAETHQFKFLDIDETVEAMDDDMHINDQQAEDIAEILKRALANKADVIVHCHAGVCRSGAVVEAGVRLGFDDLEKYRSPNPLVLKKVLKALGLE